MLNKLKKGFTIVELVIVIAVIAILAGVLIPTFSSITKNAKQSAAMQQARNAMEGTLALTGGSYPTGTDFVIDDSKDGKINYWFEYEGNTLKDTTDVNVTKTGVADNAVAKFNDDYYAVYFSAKCWISDDVKEADAKKNLAESVSLLAMAAKLGEIADAQVTALLNQDKGLNSYYTFTVGEDAAAKTFRIYYTSDIEPNLIIILGENK
ncbi:MAG: pilin [Bacilli bacterium]|nr:pilin [Bacilli bacterium]